MDQSSSIPPCDLCFETYDLEARIPKNMPCCGKALCRKCEEKMKRGHKSIKCPWCKRVHAAEEEFKKNFPLLDVIGENLKWEICAEHKEAIKLFCPQDKRKVCAYCNNLDDNAVCKGHKLVALAILEPEAEKGRKKFENDFDLLKKKYQESDKKLDDDRKTMEEMICKYFDEQQHSLQAAKIKALYNLQDACRIEKSSLNQNFGEQSSLRSELKRIISDHLNFRKTPDPKEIIDRDYSSLQDRLNYFVSSNSNGLSFEHQLSQVVPKIKSTISEQSSIMMKGWDSLIEAVPKEIIKKTPSEFENSTSEPPNRKNVFNFSSSLKFSINEDELEIEECQEEIETKLLKKNIRKLHSVVFKFEALDLEDQDWDRISEVFAELGNKYLLCVRFKSSSKNYSIKKTSRLFSIFLQDPGEMGHLHLYLNFNNKIMQLLNFILPQLTVLSSLHLTIRDAKISLKHFNEFIENLHSIAPRLEELNLDLSNMKLPLSIFKEIFINMPVLETFHLNASEIPSLSRKTISPLLDDSKNLMPNLEKLVLEISQTKIPVSDSAVLKDHFRHIKNVDLILEDPETENKDEDEDENESESERPQNQASQPQRPPSQANQANQSQRPSLFQTNQANQSQRPSLFQANQASQSQRPSLFQRPSSQANQATGLFAPLDSQNQTGRGLFSRVQNQTGQGLFGSVQNQNPPRLNLFGGSR